MVCRSNMKRAVPTTDLGKFLMHMNNFFEFMKQTFPSDKDLEYFHDQFKEFKKYNAQLIAEMFVKSALPYEKHILDRNEEFFLEELQFDNLKEQVPINLGEYESGLYDKVRKLWTSDMDSTSKDTVWKYFAILLGFGKKCME